MEKEGKLSLIFILIASLIFVLVYVASVVSLVPQDFPANNTNASATRGFGVSTTTSVTFFNGTRAQFKCNVTSLNTTTTNITNVSLFINVSTGTSFNTDNKTSVKNQTLNTTTKAIGVGETIIFNVTTPFNDGRYVWWCESQDNQTGTTPQIVYNASDYSFFTIDTTPPVFNNSKVYNTSVNPKYSTGDLVAIQVNVSDMLTLISAAKLFVNLSGTANNEVNRTVNETSPVNLTLLNLSFRLPGNSLFSVLNFTIMVNDSVHNYNITPAVLLVVEGDGTPPAIALNKPDTVFNQSSATAPDFNFTAVDNNDSLSFNLTCGINISLGASLFATVTPITATNGTPQINTTTTKLSNGTFTWNVSCTDPAGNSNTSLSRTFTVDQIAPFKLYFNLTNSSQYNNLGDTANVYELGTGSGTSRAQGETNTSIIFIKANWTDNLTQPSMALFQFFNVSANSGAGAWQTLNVTNITGSSGPNIGGWSNLSFPIPQGHNEFEGKNVSFRIVANDTLNNLNTSAIKNITIQINDTTVPTVTINGTIAVNGTNITNTRPLISWAVTEPNQLTSINVSVDSTLPPTDGGLQGCNRAAFFSSSAAGDNNVETGDGGRGWRNGSFQISATLNCPLGNGTHFVNITTVDAWGNKIVTGHTFTIQADVTPVISFNEIYYGNAIVSEQSAVNQSNVTPFANLNFSAVSGGTGVMKTFSWTSSCNTSTTTLSSQVSDFTSVNLSSIGPFNYSGCYNTEANQTVTITVADSVGNSVTNLFQFAVDHLGPSIAVQSPTDGARITGNVDVNVTAMDKMNRVASIRYFLDGGLTIFNHTINTTPITPEQGTNSTIVTRTINFTPGTHTIIMSVNDTLGNVRNSSPISFTVVGPIIPSSINTTIYNYLATVNPGISINLSIRVLNTTSGNYSLAEVTSDSDQTFELFLNINGTMNVSITDINGSGANWDKTNFSIKINGTNFSRDVDNNFTATLLKFVFFNNSFEEFLPNSLDYYGIIELPFNVSDGTGSPYLAQQIWFFPNGSNLTQATDRINVSKCTSAFTATTTTPCWNYTAYPRVGKTLLFVPHFSGGGGGNDSWAPTVNVTLPIGNQTIGMFEANITVSADAVSCFSSVNGTEANNGARNISMAKSGNVCIAQTERFKNLMASDGGYNFTFSVIDSSGNVNSYMWKFNVSDTTAPDNGIVSASGTKDGATITITGANESVNVSVYFNTQNASFSNNAATTSFNKTQTVTISGLTTVSTATTWFFNITVCDFNGNCKNNGTFEFTQTATAAAAAAASSSSSGGGGGGAAAPSTEAASTSKRWDSLDAGSSAVLTINNANIAVTGVVVDVKSAVTNAEVKVASLTSNPIVTAAAAKVYQYLQITKSNIADTDASKITISFKVPKSWLTSNGVAEGDVVLYRYSDSKWNSLPTTMSGSDANNVLYSAATPGFSTFAVGSKEAAPAVAPSPAEAGAAPAAEAPVPAAEAGAAAPKEAAMEKKGMSTTAIAWIVVAVIVVIAGLGYFMMQKKKAE